MATYDKAWNEMTREPATKAEFYQIAGITPELEEFIRDFIRRPEILNSLSQEKQQEIEAKMDAVFAIFC